MSEKGSNGGNFRDKSISGLQPRRLAGVRSVTDLGSQGGISNGGGIEQVKFPVRAKMESK